MILDGNYITIRKVNESHSGLYQCLAEDHSVTPPMEAITVIVHCELIAHTRLAGVALKAMSVLYIDISN